MIIEIEPVLLICHTCEKRAEMDRVSKDRRNKPLRFRVVARNVGMHARFMDQHRRCADEGWGTSPDLRVSVPVDGLAP